MAMKYPEEVLQKIQNKYPEYSIKELEEMVRSQFEFAAEKIKEGQEDGVFLRRLGTFRPNVQKLRETKKFKNNDGIENQDNEQ